MLSLVDLGDRDPELLDVVFDVADQIRAERVAVAAPAPQPGPHSRPIPRGMRPLAPPASMKDMARFFGRR